MSRRSRGRARNTRVDKTNNNRTSQQVSVKNIPNTTTEINININDMRGEHTPLEPEAVAAPEEVMLPEVKDNAVEKTEASDKGNANDSKDIFVRFANFIKTEGESITKTKDFFTLVGMLFSALVVVMTALRAKIYSDFWGVELSNFVSMQGIYDAILILVPLFFFVALGLLKYNFIHSETKLFEKHDKLNRFVTKAVLLFLCVASAWCTYNFADLFLTSSSKDLIIQIAVFFLCWICLTVTSWMYYSDGDKIGSKGLAAFVVSELAIAIVLLLSTAWLFVEPDKKGYFEISEIGKTQYVTVRGGDEKILVECQVNGNKLIVYPGKYIYVKGTDNSNIIIQGNESDEVSEEAGKETRIVYKHEYIEKVIRD